MERHGAELTELKEYKELINKKTAIVLIILVLIPLIVMSFYYVKLERKIKVLNADLSIQNDISKTLNLSIIEYEELLKNKNIYLENKNKELSEITDNTSIEIVSSLITYTEKSIEIINEVIKENK